MVVYRRRAPATTPTIPAAEPAILKLVGIAAPPEEDEEAAEPAEPPFVACATWMPKLVLVVVTVEPEVVTTLVTTLVAVVLAVQPDQVVHGALVPHGPEVQPDQVDGGHAEPPHQLVHGPFVHAPLLALAHGPHPWFGPPWPNGPQPPAPCHPGGPPPGAPPHPLTTEDQAEFVVHAVGHAEPPDVTEKVASGEAVTLAPALAQSWAMAS